MVQMVDQKLCKVTVFDTDTIWSAEIAVYYAKNKTYTYA